ncbi:MAG TPA: HEAT repeat domain-containing protein [Longimicrobiaceae bacterium]|nr:HEAT repeat domain-containing protein [Longimicrobiaceae bacterium]
MQSSILQRFVTGAAVALLFFASSPAGAQSLPKSGKVEVSPAAEKGALSQVKAADGFEVSLFAAPPVAMYPTCLTATPEGAVFVCVDPNLSLSVGRNRGRIMRLVDDDKDGHADRYTVFVDSIDSPRGVAWDGKALYVMHPPTLTAYYDDDGDGIADRSVDLVHGLGFGLDFRGADHGTNGIQMGIDGWIYVAVGDYGYRKAIGRDGTQIEHHGGSVVRVRPDGSDLEIYAVGTRNIYDVAIDPFMHVFSRDNTNDGDGWNTRLHYLAQNANMGYPMLYKNFPTEHFPSLFDYGPGSGTGDLWVQDPGFPAGYDNTLYTSDWTMSKVYRHPLTPKGASYDVQQDEFLSVVHPSDLAMDGASNLYVASLSGGTFTYTGDNVGYVLRVRYPEKTAAKPLDPGSASDAQLLEQLTGFNAEHRLQAQHEILRRGEKPATVQRLREIVLDSKQPAYARVAAIFTLKQLVGAEATPTLLRAAADLDPTVRALALRALVDRKEQLAGVPTALFVKALSDPDPSVQLQAINGLVRLGARDAADAIVPLTARPDPALAHIAVNALVKLGASRAALHALDTGTPAVKAGALRALQQMHDEDVVAALADRYRRSTDPAARHRLLLALARLDNQEGIWLGDWWTTRPSFLGPYFEPSAWAGTARIRPILADALLSASGAGLDSLADEFVLERVLPQGAKPLVLALSASHDPQRTEAIRALAGHSRVSSAALPVLARIDARSAPLHEAVARLLVGESDLAEGSVPLLRAAALDSSLDADVRARALAALSGADLPVAVATFAHFNPGASSDPDLDRAWRRFVSDRGHMSQLPQFVALAHDGDEAERVLAYSVLVQIARRNGAPDEVKQQVTGAIDAGWADAALAPSLARAVTIMHQQDAYSSQMSRFSTRSAN